MNGRHGALQLFVRPLE